MKLGGLGGSELRRSQLRVPGFLDLPVPCFPNGKREVGGETVCSFGIPCTEIKRRFKSTLIVVRVQASEDVVGRESCLAVIQRIAAGRNAQMSFLPLCHHQIIYYLNSKKRGKLNGPDGNRLLPSTHAPEGLVRQQSTCNPSTPNEFAILQENMIHFVTFAPFIFDKTNNNLLYNSSSILMGDTLRRKYNHFERQQQSASCRSTKIWSTTLHFIQIAIYSIHHRTGRSNFSPHTLHVCSPRRFYAQQIARHEEHKYASVIRLSQQTQLTANYMFLDLLVVTMRRRSVSTAKSCTKADSTSRSRIGLWMPPVQNGRQAFLPATSTTTCLRLQARMSFQLTSYSPSTQMRNFLSFLVASSYSMMDSRGYTTPSLVRQRTRFSQRGFQNLRLLLLMTSKGPTSSSMGMISLREGMTSGDTVLRLMISTSVSFFLIMLLLLSILYYELICRIYTECIIHQCSPQVDSLKSETSQVFRG